MVDKRLMGHDINYEPDRLQTHLMSSESICSNSEYLRLKKIEENIKKEIEQIENELKRGDECRFIFGLVFALDTLKRAIE